MIKSNKSISALVPTLIKKISIDHGSSFRIAAAAFSKRGNLLGIEMNGRGRFLALKKGGGKHAEAALIKKFGKKIDTIFVLRVGHSLSILPIHPCESCKNMANKLGIKIISIHEMLNLYQQKETQNGEA